MKKNNFPYGFMLIYSSVIFTSFFIITIMQLSGNACLHYQGLAADSAGNIYIGEDRSIKVYDDEGNFLRSFSCNTNRGYSFTIKNDNIIEFLSGDVIIMDLNGEIKKELIDSDLYRYGSIRSDGYTASDGTRYVLKNEFLRDRVYKIDTGSHRELVYEMPVLSFLLRWLFVLTALSMVIVIPALISRNVVRWLKEN